MAAACLPSIKRTADVAENHFATLIRQCYSESTFPCVSRDFLSCSTTSRTWKETLNRKEVLILIQTRTGKEQEKGHRHAHSEGQEAPRQLQQPVGNCCLLLSFSVGTNLHYFQEDFLFLFGQLICWTEKLCAVF